MKGVIFTTHIENSFPISVIKTGKDRYIVEYGSQRDKGDYEYASRKLGEAIMHALGCAGKTD